MTTLPILGVACTSADVQRRLADLSSWSEQLERGRARRTTGVLLVVGSLFAGVLALLGFGSRAFTHASWGLLALAGTWSFYLVATGRMAPRTRRNALLLLVLVFLLAMLIDVVPTPVELLAALDLRSFPAEAIVAALLSVLGVTGSLLWASTSTLPGALESGLLAFVGQLAHPLLADAAIDARGFLRVSPFAPGTSHWQDSVEGTIHLRTLERIVCELVVPLERGERVVVQVRETVITSTRRGRNRRGKYKVKAKGYQRSLETSVRWMLDQPAPSTADLTQHLHGHLQRRGRVPADVQLRARGERDAIEVRIRQQVRDKMGTYVGLDHQWIDVGLVHESARFLAEMRASLLGPNG